MRALLVFFALLAAGCDDGMLGPSPPPPQPPAPRVCVQETISTLGGTTRSIVEIVPCD